jgi:hypothetical protein
MLTNLKEIKSQPDGGTVTFQARVLRFWDAGGVRMCLVGDASALMRVEVGDVAIDLGGSYEFRDAVVEQYEGGWSSVSIVEGGEASSLDREVPISQDEPYIERTFKILSGIQRKRARQEGRLPPWKHPSDRDSDGGPS